MRVGKDVPLLFQPGTRWSYGASADILGAVLERVSDLPLDELFRKLIFTPLGMKDTDFYVPEEKRPRLAQLYAWGENGLQIEPDPHLGMTDYRKRPAFFSGGAGLISTLSDYAQFANALAGKGLHKASGTRLFGEGTWRYLTTPQLSPPTKNRNRLAAAQGVYLWKPAPGFRKSCGLLHLRSGRRIRLGRLDRPLFLRLSRRSDRLAVSGSGLRRKHQRYCHPSAKYHLRHAGIKRYRARRPFVQSIHICRIFVM